MAKNKKSFVQKSIRPYEWIAKPISILILGVGIIADIFLILGQSDIMYFGLLIFYVISSVLFRIKSKFTIILALIVFLIMYIQFLLSGTSEVTENAAVWLFLLLTVGMLQQWRELKN